MIIKTRKLTSSEIKELEKIDKQNKIEAEILPLKKELTALSEDIIQNLAGEIVPDIETRKAQFIEVHNQIRTLLDKKPRAIK